ncbi:MAG TPA: copper homeostasis protein CutC, partial [Candidatus Latescibacteria bacterium]|nr:copper homeostasis protein CutC [Candidatus Latescibacterota bacterium]
RFEICIDSVAGAIAAQEAGAHRVELCQALSVGGTTPSAAMIQSVKAASNFPVHVLIRPRGGDFVFCDDEWDVMARDIELAGEWGVDGVVIGGLCADRTLDVDHCRRLIERARPMSVTFHRAFDLCADPMTALRQLLDLRVDRLLTSGQAATAHEGRGLLRDLVRAAGERLLIMAGAGIHERNVAELVRDSGVNELHFTGRLSSGRSSSGRSGKGRSAHERSDSERSVSQAGAGSVQMGSDAQADHIREETDANRIQAIMAAAERARV